MFISKRVLSMATATIIACFVGIGFLKIQLHADRIEMTKFAVHDAIYQNTIRQMEEIHESRRQRVLEEIDREAELPSVIAREIAENPAYSKPAMEPAYIYDPEVFPELVTLESYLNRYPCSVTAADAICMANVAEAECRVIESDYEVSLFFWNVLWRLRSGIFTGDSVEALLKAKNQYATPETYTERPSDRMMYLAIDVVRQYAKYVNGDTTVSPTLPDGFYYFHAEEEVEKNGWHNYYYAIKENGERVYFEFGSTEDPYQSGIDYTLALSEMGGPEPPFSPLKYKV